MASYAGTWVFVYGTLLPGGLYWRSHCEGRVMASFPAKARGELYDLGVGYPALLPRGPGWVCGRVLVFEREADLVPLDGLEGYAPDRPAEANEYERRKVACFKPAGVYLGEAWTYVMSAAGMSSFRAVRIPGGDWAAAVGRAQGRGS